jgi:hypothetical protein
VFSSYLLNVLLQLANKKNGIQNKKKKAQPVNAVWGSSRCLL